MRNFDVRIPVKLEVKVPIFGPTPHQPSTPQSPSPPHTHTHTLSTQTFRHSQKILTQAENFDPRKKIDSHNKV